MFVNIQNSHFANSRSRHGGGGKHFALGNRVQRERPGFGSDSGPSLSTSRTTVDSSNPFDDGGPPARQQTISVGPMTDWRGGSTASSGMSSTNRTSAMKAAFQSQFKSSFVCISIYLQSTGFLFYVFFSAQVAATDTGLKSHSVAVPSSVSQKRTGQPTKNESTSTTKRSRFSD